MKNPLGKTPTARRRFVVLISIGLVEASTARIARTVHGDESGHFLAKYCLDIPEEIPKITRDTPYLAVDD